MQLYLQQQQQHMLGVSAGIGFRRHGLGLCNSACSSRRCKSSSSSSWRLVCQQEQEGQRRMETPAAAAVAAGGSTMYDNCMDGCVQVSFSVSCTVFAEAAALQELHQYWIQCKACCLQLKNVDVFV
jgi:hypothetical protein